MTALNQCVYFVGAITCAYLALAILKAVLGALNAFVGAKNLREYGSWALVTGGTDGIGKSIIKELAKQKINLVIVSRSAEKLGNVAKEISDKYNVEVKTTALDCSATTPTDYSNIFEAYKDLDIGIIVNNVGLSYDHPDYLEKLDTERMWQIIHMNIIPATCLTKEFVAGMASKRKGLVVNVSSASGIFSSPLLSVYSATKAYIITLTEALRQEYAQKNVHFQVICPLFVATAMTGMRRALRCPSPDDYARSAVATFGKTNFTAGYWVHEIEQKLSGLLPTALFNNMQLKTLERGRARYYRKLNQKKE